MATQTRIASVFDVERVAPLLDAYRQLYAQPADVEAARRFLRERFAHRESVLLIATDDDGATSGFVQLYPLFSTVRAARTYLLNDLFVVPAARRRGVAKRLLAAAVDFARADGADSLSLQTAHDNAPARSLYESLGWIREERFGEYTIAVRRG